MACFALAGVDLTLKLVREEQSRFPPSQRASA